MGDNKYSHPILRGVSSPKRRVILESLVDNSLNCQSLMDNLQSANQECTYSHLRTLIINLEKLNLIKKSKLSNNGKNSFSITTELTDEGKKATKLLNYCNSYVLNSNTNFTLDFFDYDATYSVKLISGLYGLKNDGLGYYKHLPNRNVNKKELAQFTNLLDSTTSRLIESFSEMGIVDYQGRNTLELKFNENFEEMFFKNEIKSKYKRLIFRFYSNQHYNQNSFTFDKLLFEVSKLGCNLDKELLRKSLHREVKSLCDLGCLSEKNPARNISEVDFTDYGIELSEMLIVPIYKFLFLGENELIPLRYYRAGKRYRDIPHVHLTGRKSSWNNHNL